MEEGKTLNSECKTAGVHCNDFHLLTEEKFDFDLSLSPTSENEDEVFISPIGHKGKFTAVSSEAYEKSESTVPSLMDDRVWSPPAGDKFLEIFKEAHLVALQLTSGRKKKRNDIVHSREQNTESVEKFVKESKSKLKILEKGITGNKTPTAIRRETYCIWDSPTCQSVPSVLKRPEQPVGIYNSPFPQVALNASSPVKTNKSPEASVARLAQAKNDSHLNKNMFQTVQKSSFGSNKYLAAGQPKPGNLPSPSNRMYANSMGSSEDLFSDKSSIASEAGDLSSCADSVQSKKTLPTPSKLGTKTRQLKPPSDVLMRRNTSSSSSSSVSSMNSSLNSSISISPKRGNGKTSVSNAPTSLSRLSSGTNKISVVKPVKRFSLQASHSDAAGKQPIPRCAKEKPSGNIHRLRANLLLETSSSGIQKQGSDRSLQKLLQRSTLENTNASSSPKTKPKTALPILKEDAFSENGLTRILKSDRVLSCSNVGSNIVVTPPANQLQEGLVLKSCSTVNPALRTPQIRHSTLPTPIGRHLSGIPTLTPKTMPRTVASPNLLGIRQTASVSSKKTSVNRNIHLLCLPNSECVNEKKKTWISSSSSSTEDFPSPQVVPIALDFSPDKAITETEQDVIKKGEPAEEIPVKENLLIEFEIDKTPVAIQECENKPLIDLFNTPEIIKAPILKPAGQLIDLSSPLIKLSPEGNKENLDLPLLKF